MADIGLERGRLVITSQQKNTVDLRKITAILVRRRQQIFGISCAAMSVASILAFMVKPTYQSSMQILVSPNLNNGARLNREDTEAHFDVFDYTPQLKLMLSSKLIQKVVDLLRYEYPDIQVEDIKGQKGQPQPLDITKVESATKDNQQVQVFEVSFKDNDPGKTQKVLQTIQKVYQDYKIEQQKNRLSQGLSFINEQIPKVKNEIAQAENNLEQFRKKHNLLDPELQSKILLESLANIKQQLTATRAQLQSAQARYNNLKKELDASPQNTLASSGLSQSPRYQTLLNEIQKTELSLAQERLRYTDNYPTVQKLIQQYKSQMALLEEEIGRSHADESEKEVKDIILKTKQLLTSEPTSQKTVSQIPEQITGVNQKLAEEFMQVQTTLLGLRANEKSLAESEAQLRSEVNKYPSLIAEYQRLLPEVQIHRKTLEQLLQTQQSLGLTSAQGGFDLQVLEEPQRGINLDNPRFLLILIGALLGPSLGVAAALSLEAIHDAVSSPQDMQRLTNLPILGTVPKLSRLSPKKRLFRLPSVLGKVLPASFQGVSLDIHAMLNTHETLDITYQNIQLKSSTPCKSLMITSATSGEGKSTLAMGLTMSAARLQQRVLLIDANFRQPSLHKMFGLSNDWGLSLLLVDEINTTAQEYVQPIHPSIDVLTAGPTPEDTVKLLNSGRMKEILEFFKQIYDVVLLDTSPILGTVDTRMMAFLCDGIVMVGRLGRISSLELKEATDVLSHLNLIGIIANEAA